MFERIYEIITHIIHYIRHYTFHFYHTMAHCLYFGAVFAEGHGLYASFGGLLFILTIYGLVMHDD